MSRTRSARRLPSVLAVVVAGLVLLLTASGGAVAGAMITGAQIKNGSVTGLDVKDRSLGVGDLSRATKRNLTGPRGPRGYRGQPGVVRGWAHVGTDGTVLSSSPGVTVDSGRGGSLGSYCVAVPGVDPDATAPVVTLDFDRSSTNVGGSNAQQAFAEVSRGLSDCAVGSFLVSTFVRQYTTADSGTRLASTVLVSANQGFYVVVP